MGRNWTPAKIIELILLGYSPNEAKYSVDLIFWRILLKKNSFKRFNLLSMIIYGDPDDIQFLTVFLMYLKVNNIQAIHVKVEP